MEKLIAVIADEQERIAELQEVKKIIIYGYSYEGWVKQKEVPLPDIFTGGMGEVRKKLEGVIGELGACRILAGKAITGLVYNQFDQAGFILCELTDFSVKDLESLYTSIVDEIDRSNSEVLSVPTAPAETDRKGYFFFDFGLLKKSGSEVTSKAALLPFFSKVKFTQLDLRCDHVMPWLEAELNKKGYSFTIEEISLNQFKIMIKSE